MSGVDNRIVTMKFDNAQFEQGAKTSLSTLQKLKESMNFSTIGATATKALGGIQGLLARFGVKNPFANAISGAAELNKATQAVGSQGVASIEGGITGLSNKWLAMATVATTALSNIVTSAQQAGTQMVKSLTVDPVKGGLQEYETNLNSIQTILANTKVSGANLDDVNHALEELNHYSDKTIYNFSEMARNIGTFTAAGVDLETSTASIKGIANLAALSGSNSQQAATAMYQLSQEIASGRVSLMGWNSVVNAGMGGSTFQRALVQTAQAMGTLNGRTVEFQGKMKNATIDGMSFRDSIMAKPGETSWLSKEVLTGTLKQFTNDMTDAELAAQGFNEAQIKDIQSMAKTAEDAATKVKTLSGVFDTAKEVVGSGWAKTWQTVFGDFKEARTFFTNFSNGFNDILGGMADRRNELLGEWKEGGGRDMAIEGVTEMWKSLLTILRPIGDAFRDIFPRQTAEGLLSLTERFVEFAKNLAISKDTAASLGDTFRGVFAIFSIIGKVIGAVVGAFMDLFGVVGDGSGGILSFTGGIGNAIVAFDQFLEKSGLLEAVFGSISGILQVPIRLITSFADVLGSLFSGFDSGGADGATGAMDKFSGAADGFANGAERVMAIFEALGTVIGNIGGFIVDSVKNIGEVLSSAITPETFDRVLDTVNTALFGALVLLFRRFFGGGLNVDIGGGFLSATAEALGEAGGVLQTLQANLKADILLKIAAALAVMAVSLLLLASINPGDLSKALGAMGAGFAVLGTTMVMLIRYIGPIGAMKLPLISAAMIGLATAMLLFAGAMKIMATMDVAEIARGLVGIAGVLFVIQKAMANMSAPGMLRSAAAILILSVALNLLGVAMKVFASLSWNEMAKGLVGVVGSLTAIALAMKLMPKGMVFQAAAILVLSVALNALGLALKIFASMSWGEMAKGAVALGGALLIIAGAMNIMPKGMLLQAAALVVVAGALTVLGGALKIMGSMGWKDIAQGLVLLGGAMLILAVGLNAMGPSALVGAGALVVAAGALAVLVPVLAAMGALSWGTILTSLGTLAAIFTVLGLAGFVLGPLVPVLIGLGAALVLVGAGLALAGVGALAFASAVGIIVAAGTASIAVLGGILEMIINAIPPFFAALGQALGRFAMEIAQNGPAFAKAMGAILGAILDAVIKNVPKIGRAFLTLLNTALRVIVTSIPRIVSAGLRLILGFLSAIEQNIGKIVDIAARIIVNFIDGIARNLGRIIQSGVNLVIKFVNGVATAIENNSEELGEAGGRLAVAMVNGLANGIRGGAGVIKEAALDAARAAWEEVKDFFKVGSPSKLLRDDLGRWLPIGMALGIRDEERAPADAIERMGHTTLDRLNRTMAAVEEGFAMSADLSPTITPVLDLTALTQEANKMSSILATAPIMAGVSYQTAADISAMTQPPEGGDGPDVPGTGGSGDQYNELNLHLHSPKPIDSVESYRAGKTLISIAKEALK